MVYRDKQARDRREFEDNKKAISPFLRQPHVFFAVFNTNRSVKEYLRKTDHYPNKLADPQKDSVYRLLGVDPGTNILGFALIEVENKQPRLLEMGVLHLHQWKEQPDKLRHIFERISQIIKDNKPRAMAIEAPFYGKNPQSMLKLGRAQGVAIAAAVMMGVPIAEYAPRKIKQSVTGNGNAVKEQVAAMLTQLFKIDLSGHYLDATDALATAMCHFYQQSNPIAAAGKSGGWARFIQDNPGRIKDS